MRGLMVWIAAAAVLAGCGTDAPPATDEVAPTPTVVPENSPPVSPDAPVDVAPAPEPVSETATTPEPAEVEPEWQADTAAIGDQDAGEVLRRAEAAFEAGDFIEGEDQALALYLALLEADPAHKEAQAGVDRIVLALAEQVDAALDAHDPAVATRALRVLRKLRPLDARTQAQQTRWESERKIASELKRAQSLFEQGKLVDPPQDNAADVYAAILAQDSRHAEALAGLSRVETELVGRATAAAEAGDYALSDKLLADAARARPGSGQVQNAGSQIVQMRQDRATELLREAHTAASRGDVARAEQLLAQLEQVSAQAQGIEDLREQIERARLYGGYAPGQSISDRLQNGGDGPDLSVLPIGSLRMGSPSGEAQRKKEEGPQREIVFARGFALGKSEVTVAQFRAFVQATGYRSTAQQRGESSVYDERSGNLAPRDGVTWERDFAGREAEPDLPVVHVSWEDAQAYVDWLARETGKSYRLPSEAEFEYALRAGSSTRYPWGEGSPPRMVENLTGEKDRSSRGRAWNNGFTGYGDGFWGPAPVRAYPANDFGLHDTNGNVSEWVADCWHDSYKRAPDDASPWINPGCKSRVIRGASWASAPDQARSAFRLGAAPRTTHARLGFRVARDL